MIFDLYHRQSLLSILLGVLASCSPKPANDDFIVAFGSCVRANAKDHMWEEILEAQPNIFVFMGDNIYGDTEDPEVLRSKYEKQKDHPDLQQLFETAEVIGTWDDHDYGINDGGKEFPGKDQSQQIMLDFFDTDAGAAVRKTPGVYQAFDYLICDDKQLKIILLDTRYFRDSLLRDTSDIKVYMPNPNGDILGEDQWEWLDTTLKNSSADYHILVSSIQVLSEQHPYEKWANFPKSRERLFKMIEAHKPDKLVMISGDRHFAEVSKTELPDWDYPLYDITSSGLTNAWAGAKGEINQHRVSDQYTVVNYGLMKINCVASNYTFEIRGKDNTILYQLTPDM